MTLLHWLAISNVASGVLLLVAIWRWWRAKCEGEETLFRLLQEGQENKRLRELNEQHEEAVRELRTSARSLGDLDDGITVIVTDVDVRHTGIPGARGNVVSPGHRRRMVTFRLRSEDRVHEAILASGEGRKFVVPVEDVIDIMSDGGLDW